VTTFALTPRALTATIGPRIVELEELEINYKVRAMVQVGFDPEVARVFSFSGADRSKVISLAQRRKVIL